MSDRDYHPYDRLDPVPSFSLTSTDVTDGQPLKAAQYGADAGGGDVSPQLSWSGAPEGTKSYAVTVYDPDAPPGPGFGHGAAANTPASAPSLEPGAGPRGVPPPGGPPPVLNERPLPHFTGAPPP